MAGLNGVKIKLMPDSPNTNLEAIEEKAKEIVKSLGWFNKEYSIEPIAFGLKAVIAFFQFPEDKEVEKVEEALKKIKNAQSVQLIDMRKIAWFIRWKRQFNKFLYYQKIYIVYNYFTMCNFN